MKNLLKSEELLVAISSLFLLTYLPVPFHWGWYFLLFFAPDLGMLGYLFGPKLGAISYNIFHHKGLMSGIAIWGFALGMPLLCAIGIVFFAHAAFDRIMGYGLKYFTGFKNTHLGDLK